VSATDAELRARNLRTLALLAALFLLPLAMAFCAYYGTDWRPSAHLNHGQLIDPARPLPAVALPLISLETRAPDAPSATATPFRGRWSLVYIGGGNCDAACRDTLYVMRQTRLGLNTDMTRVERVFLVSRDCCNRVLLAREHAGLVVLDASAASQGSLLALFPTTEREHTLFVVDPLGNLMMSYDARGNPHGLLEDLKKLLRLSHIG
jgi:cytochrome oxidase Cu insertion factor (SCO1/SenC/PrrC family)